MVMGYYPVGDRGKGGCHHINGNNGGWQWYSHFHINGDNSRNIDELLIVVVVEAHKDRSDNVDKGGGQSGQ